MNDRDNVSFCVSTKSLDNIFFKENQSPNYLGTVAYFGAIAPLKYAGTVNDAARGY